MSARVLLLLSPIAFAIACGHAAPPPTPPATTSTTASAAPPPPSCESIGAPCVAGPDTKARIQHTGYSVAVPSGWKYAQEDAATYAETTHALLVVTTEPVASGVDAARASALARIVERAGVKREKKSAIAFGKKPDKELDVGGLHVVLSQVNGASHAEAKGALLLFSTTLPEGSVLVGLGWADDADDSGADQAILTAIESIRGGAK